MREKKKSKNSGESEKEREIWKSDEQLKLMIIIIITKKIIEKNFEILRRLAIT